MVGSSRVAPVFMLWWTIIFNSTFFTYSYLHNLHMQEWAKLHGPFLRSASRRMHVKFQHNLRTILKNRPFSRNSTMVYVTRISTSILNIMQYKIQNDDIGHVT